MVTDVKRVYQLSNRLWQDEHASVLTAEVTLLATVLVVGIIVGVGSFRDSVITEWADYAQAIGSIDQSYNIPDVVDASGVTVIRGGYFVDFLDVGDSPLVTGDTLAFPGPDGFGDVFSVPATGEGP